MRGRLILFFAFAVAVIIDPVSSVALLFLARHAAARVWRLLSRRCSTGELIRDYDGFPEVRICTFELLRMSDGREKEGKIEKVLQ